MTTTMNTSLSIASDFSKVPAGRYLSDGDFSGEVFRDKVLAPALMRGGEVLVDFDGTEGYGSSFLEEAFGGLIRVHNFQLEDLSRRLKFKSDEDPSLVDEVREYLADAASVKRKH